METCSEQSLAEKQTTEDTVTDDVLEGYSGFKAIVSRVDEGTMSRCYSSKC